MKTDAQLQVMDDNALCMLENDYYELLNASDGFRAGAVIHHGKRCEQLVIADGCVTWQPFPKDKMHAAMQTYIAAHSSDPMRRLAARNDVTPATTVPSEPAKPAASAPAILVTPAAPSVAERLTSPATKAALAGLNRSDTNEARSNWARIVAFHRGERASLQDVPPRWRAPIDRAKARIDIEQRGNANDLHGWKKSAKRIGAVVERDVS